MKILLGVIAYLIIVTFSFALARLAGRADSRLEEIQGKSAEIRQVN